MLLSAALGLASCGPAAPAVQPQHATWAMAQWPATSQAELEQGRSLFLQRCSSCHRPPAPDSHAPAEWPGEIAEMKERAHLTADEQVLIERYVITLATIK